MNAPRYVRFFEEFGIEDVPLVPLPITWPNPPTAQARSASSAFASGAVSHTAQRWRRIRGRGSQLRSTARDLDAARHAACPIVASYGGRDPSPHKNARDAVSVGVDRSVRSKRVRRLIVTWPCSTSSMLKPG
jgi:hypothetical protein